MPARILCVEDNPQNMRLVRKYLGGTDYIFLEAEDGMSGLQMASEENPDLILMDINLPDMSGIEVTQRIKAQVHLKHIPILALTANTIHGNEGKYLEAGFDGFIGKPIDSTSLLEKIEDCLRNKQSQD